LVDATLIALLCAPMPVLSIVAYHYWLRVLARLPESDASLRRLRASRILPLGAGFLIALCYAAAILGSPTHRQSGDDVTGLVIGMMVSGLLSYVGAWMGTCLAQRWLGCRDADVSQ